MMSDAVEETEQSVLEWEAERFAIEVRNILKERDQPLEEKEALATLAVLDAEHDITAHMDVDEVDIFLEEFVEAFGEAEKKHDKIEDAADDTKSADKKEEDGDKKGADDE